MSQQHDIVWSVVRLGHVCIYLVCAATVSLAASTAPRSRTTSDTGGQKALSSRTNSLQPFPGTNSRSHDQELPLNPDLKTPLTATTTYRHRRPRHQRKNNRVSGKHQQIVPEVSSNAADVDLYRSTTITGLGVELGHPGGSLDQGVIASTPERSSSEQTEIRSLCPNCRRGSEDNHVTSTNQPLNRDDLTTVRIESVKQQILDKLRLSRPPQVNVSNLHIPAPMFQIPDLSNGGGSKNIWDKEGDTIYGDQGEENYYGKTTKIIIQAEQDETACWSSTSPGRCFTFRFSSANTNSNLQSAQLWVYWNGSVFSESPSNKVNLTVEGKPTPSNTGFTPISTYDLNDVTHPGWVTFDLKHVVRRWHRHNREDHSILVTCEECAGFEHEVTRALSTSPEEGLAPFIVINTAQNKRNSRVRRSNDCTFIGSSECCKESLEIRFAELGWNWVIMPLSFEANFCRGVCRLRTNLQSDAAATFYHQRNLAMQRRGISYETCCAPKIMSSLSIIYINEDKEFIHAVIPDMTIESCSCSF